MFTVVYTRLISSFFYQKSDSAQLPGCQLHLDTGRLCQASLCQGHGDLQTLRKDLAVHGGHGATETSETWGSGPLDFLRRWRKILSKFYKKMGI